MPTLVFDIQNRILPSFLFCHAKLSISLPVLLLSQPNVPFSVLLGSANRKVMFNGFNPNWCLGIATSKNNKQTSNKKTRSFEVEGMNYVLNVGGQRL